ncbi:MAG: hypothetical protein AAB511_00030 [Patescibacteria group bacterium]
MTEAEKFPLESVSHQEQPADVFVPEIRNRKGVSEKEAIALISAVPFDKPNEFFDTLREIGDIVVTREKGQDVFLISDIQAAAMTVFRHEARLRTLIGVTNTYGIRDWLKMSMEADPTEDGMAQNKRVDAEIEVRRRKKG